MKHNSTNIKPSEISFSDFRKNVDFAVFFDYSDNDFSTSIEAAAQAYCDEFNRILGQIDMYQDASCLSMLNSYIKNYQELCKVSTIKEITIGKNVSNIGNMAFVSCKAVVYCKATTPPTLVSSSTYTQFEKATQIYVPEESLNLYKTTTGWKSHAKIIEPYKFD